MLCKEGVEILLRVAHMLPVRGVPAHSCFNNLLLLLLALPVTLDLTSSPHLALPIFSVAVKKQPPGAVLLWRWRLLNPLSFLSWSLTLFPKLFLHFGWTHEYWITDEEEWQHMWAWREQPLKSNQLFPVIWPVLQQLVCTLKRTGRMQILATH